MARNRPSTMRRKLDLIGIVLVLGFALSILQALISLAVLVLSVTLVLALIFKPKELAAFLALCTFAYLFRVYPAGSAMAACAVFSVILFRRMLAKRRPRATHAPKRLEDWSESRSSQG